MGQPDDDPRRVIIFRNRLRPGVSSVYERRGGEIYALAARMPGLVGSKDFVAEDGERLAVIEFASAGELAAWRDHAEHRRAQAEGRERYYTEYRLQICQLLRESRFTASGPPTESPPPSPAVDVTGGCACGAVRYRVRGAPWDETICHCVDCRRAAGAPAMGWATFRAADVAWLAGERRRRRSSERAQRGFCGDCGTQLTFELVAAPDEIDLATATLDTPEAVPPKDHTFTRSQIAWAAFADGLPRWTERRPEPEPPGVTRA